MKKALISTIALFFFMHLNAQTLIYQSGKSSPIYKYDGKMLYAGSSPDAVGPKRYICTATETYEGVNFSCNPTFSIQKDRIYRNGTYTDNNWLLTLDYRGKNVFKKGTNEIAFHFDGKKLKQGDEYTGRTVLEADKEVSLAIMLTVFYDVYK